MNGIESNIRIGGHLVVSSIPKEYRTPVVLLALAALAGLTYYLLKRHFTLSIDAQKIRNTFKKPPESLGFFDLYYLAKTIESLGVVKTTAAERFKVKVSSSFFNLFQKKKYIVHVDEGHTLRIQYIEATLGRGGFGKVVKLIDLHDGKKTALKVAKTNSPDPTAADEDLEKEHQNLMQVHESGHATAGVQEKPLTPLLTIIKYNSFLEQNKGYEGPIYDGSLDKLDVKTLPLKARLQCALQILQGMKTLYSNKLINHDLKPQNILYRKGPDQNPLIVHVSDLGGVTRESQLKDEIDKGLPHTPFYADTNRIELAEKMPIKFVQMNLVKSSEKYALRLTIFWVLTGHDVDEDSPDQIWENAGFPKEKKFTKLFHSLNKGFETGLLSLIYQKNIEGLEQKVSKCLKALA